MKTIVNHGAGMVSLPGGVTLSQGENNIADKIWEDAKEHPAVKKMIDSKKITEGKMEKVTKEDTVPKADDKKKK